jgi:hypothetical protein
MLESSINPTWAVPRFAIANDVLHVSREIRVEHRGVTGFLLVSFGECDAV